MARSNLSAEAAIIGSSTRVRGRVNGNGDLRVDGRVDGEILLAQGDLTLGETAEVDATVRADNIHVLGRLEGDVQAAGKLSVGAGASVRGNVRAKSLTLEDGANFSGQLDAEFDLPAELMKPGTVPARKK